MSVRKETTEILVLGGGYAGVMAALRLAGKTRRLNARVTLINGQNEFVERLRLHEHAMGDPPPRQTLPYMLRGSRVHQHRAHLFGLAYRMLGSATEADDILQDAFLRVADQPEETIRHPRTYLATVVTRLCLNYLATARVQREQYLGPWLPEPVFTRDGAGQPDPAARAMTHDSLSLAFPILLESLSPAERAVFLLREVFDYSYAEIATMLDKSQAACRQLFSRARQHVTANRPRYNTTLQQQQRLLAGFIDSVETGAIEEFLQLLTDDVSLVPDGGGQRGAAIQVLTGRDAVVAFIRGARRLTPPGLRYRLVTLNGERAILAETAEGRPFFAVFVQACAGLAALLHVIGGAKLRGLATPRGQMDEG